MLQSIVYGGVCHTPGENIWGPKTCHLVWLPYPLQRGAIYNVPPIYMNRVVVLILIKRTTEIRKRSMGCDSGGYQGLPYCHTNLCIQARCGVVRLPLSAARPRTGWLGLGLGIGLCSSGPTCKIEVDHKRPVGMLLLVVCCCARSQFRGSAYTGGIIPIMRHDTGRGV